MDDQPLAEAEHNAMLSYTRQPAYFCVERIDEAAPSSWTSDETG
jgi:hypothetical protein